MIFSLNVSKSAENCGFEQIYWKKSLWKSSIFVIWLWLKILTESKLYERFMKVRRYLSFLYSANEELHKPYFRPHHVKRFIKTNMELVCIERK